jgi:hypothetical protein
LAGSNYIEDNLIFDISSSSNQAAGISSSASVIGISVLSNTEGTIQNVIGNTIYNLNANNAGATTVAAFGLYFSGPTNAQRNIIERNFIHSINSSSTSNNSILIGILLHRGNNTLYNNVISLGVNVSRGYRIYGIWDDSGSSNNNNLYFNTIYIGGDVTAGTGTSVSTALWNQNNTSTRDYRNNIFANQRLLSGVGSDNLYSVRIGGRTNLTMDYNNYWSVVNRLGRSGSRPLRPNLSSWRAETHGDQNSFEVDPLFVNTSGNWTSAQDFITDISIGNLPGIVIAGIDDDYDFVGRLDPPKIGAFENNNFVWYGTVSTDFSDPDNWTDGGGDGIVPPNGADVKFATTPYRYCYLDQERTIRDIIINSSNTNNYFVLNGQTLNLTGELSFTNDAKLDAKTTGSVLVLKGTTEQSLALGTILDNEFAGLTLDNELGFEQNTDFLITEAFNLSSGAYSIGANTLTINGSVSQTSGTLTGGATSNIIFGGVGAATILPAVQLNNLTINRASGINMSGSVSVAGTLALTDGELTLGANQLTISGNSPTGTGSVDASNSSAELLFSNTSAITLLSTFFGGNAVNNLTISGAGGVTSRGDFTINGILNLQVANPSATKGCLDMFNSGDPTDERKTLSMGASATTIGIGDVTGKIKRNSIDANTAYTFGSQFSTITFTGGTGAELPSDITFIIKIGTAPPNSIKDDAVQRYYEIIRTGGSSPTRFNLNLRYLDSELNGNEQSKMVFWDHHVPYNGLSPHEHGVSFHNTTDNYMALASHGIGYLVQGEYTGEITYVDDVTTPPNQAKIWLIANRNTPTGSDVFIWIGPYDSNTDWTSDNNWADNCSPASAATGSCPDAPYNGATISPDTHQIFIQSAASECVAPDADLRAYSIYVEEGGEFVARTGRKIETDYIRIFESGTFTAIDNTIDVLGSININNGNVSWNNAGEFEAGTSKVYFKNADAAIAGSTDFYDVEIPATYKLSMIDGSRMGIENTLTVSGTFNTSFYGNTTVEYNGAAQTIVNPDNNEYSTLILSGSGAKTLPGSLTKILADFEMDGTASTTGTVGLTIDGNMSIASGATFSTGAYDHVLDGNFENNGTFNASSGYSFTFNGNASQLIAGDVKTSFDILELYNSSGLNMLADVDVDNELRLSSGIIDVADNILGINGTITGVSATDKINVSNLSSLNFGGSGAYTIPDNLFVNNPDIDNLTINRNGGVSIGNQDFTINGNIDLLNGNLVVGSSTLGINGTTSGTSQIELSNSSSLSFGGTDQFIIPDDYFAGTTEINNLTINRTDGVVIGNQTFTLNGTLDLERGELSAEGKTINIVGNITGNSGTIGTNSTSILNFTESLITDPAIYLPSSVFSNNTLGSLLVNRTNGLYLGNQDINIDDELVLENGVIYGNSNLIIFNASASFSTSSTEPQDADENRFISGCVRKIGNTAFSFPIGIENVFAPINISEASSGSSVSDYFDACYYNYDATLDGYFTTSLGAELHHVSNSEYWTLDRNATGVNEVQVGLTWDTRSGGVTDPEDLRVVKWDGAQWSNLGQDDVTLELGQGNITSELVSSFSPFTLGSVSQENPLPVSLLYVETLCVDNLITVNWATASETNNDYFELQRSDNANVWTNIGIVMGNGNSMNKKEYSFLDTTLILNKAYYRIKQVDFNGTETYLPIVSSNCDVNADNLIQIFPNPAEDFIQVVFDFYSQYQNYVILNAKGQVIMSGVFKDRTTSIDISKLSEGTYFLNIANESVKTSFVKK